MSHPDPSKTTGRDDATEAARDGEAAPEADATAARELARATQERLDEVVVAYRALKAENDGYRERVNKNAERRFAQRHERLLLKFIDILDNLDRALEAAELSYAGGPLIEGLILVRTQLLQTLQEEGLERIPVLGLPYDPEGAEAVETRPVDDPEQHHVVLKDLQRGYRLNGQVARAAQVVVGQYGGELPLAEPQPPQGGDEPGSRGELGAGDDRARAAADAGEGDSGRVEVVDEGPADDESEASLAAAAAAAAAAFTDPDPEPEPAPLAPEPEPDAAHESDERYGVESDEESLEAAALAAAALVEGAEAERELGAAEPEADEPDELFLEPEPDVEAPEPREAGDRAGDEQAIDQPDPATHPLDEVDPSVFDAADDDEEDDRS